jgi:hypothetical protein
MPYCEVERRVTEKPSAKPASASSSWARPGRTGRCRRVRHYGPRNCRDQAAGDGRAAAEKDGVDDRLPVVGVGEGGAHQGIVEGRLLDVVDDAHEGRFLAERQLQVRVVLDRLHVLPRHVVGDVDLAAEEGRDAGVLVGVGDEDDPVEVGEPFRK